MAPYPMQPAPANAPSDLLPVASRHQLAAAALLALGAGAFLATGFIPLSQELVDYLITPMLPGRARILAWLQCLAFPALALVFHYSLPQLKARQARFARPLTTLVLPGLVALAYGLLHPGPSIFALDRSPETELAIAWSLLIAPLGEEILFRGWVYGICERLWPKRLATATNPLPLAAWASAAAFAVWHFQNWGIEAPQEVLFQVAYTFGVGLWLGWLRWQTGGLLLPIAAHLSINIAASLW